MNISLRFVSKLKLTTNRTKCFEVLSIKTINFSVALQKYGAYDCESTEINVIL